MARRSAPRRNNFKATMAIGKPATIARPVGRSDIATTATKLPAAKPTNSKDMSASEDAPLPATTAATADIQIAKPGAGAGTVK